MSGQTIFTLRNPVLAIKATGFILSYTYLYPNFFFRALKRKLEGIYFKKYVPGSVFLSSFEISSTFEGDNPVITFSFLNRSKKDLARRR